MLGTRKDENTYIYTCVDCAVSVEQLNIWLVFISVCSVLLEEVVCRHQSLLGELLC